MCDCRRYFRFVFILVLDKVISEVFTASVHTRSKLSCPQHGRCKHISRKLIPWKALWLERIHDNEEAHADIITRWYSSTKGSIARNRQPVTHANASLYFEFNLRSPATQFIQDSIPSGVVYFPRFRSVRFCSAASRRRAELATTLCSLPVFILDVSPECA